MPSCSPMTPWLGFVLYLALPQTQGKCYIISLSNMRLPTGIWEILYYMGCLVVPLITWKASVQKSQLLSKTENLNLKRCSNCSWHSSHADHDLFSSDFQKVFSYSICSFPQLQCRMLQENCSKAVGKLSKAHAGSLSASNLCTVVISSFFLLASLKRKINTCLCAWIWVYV